MPDFIITSPDGQKFRIHAPEGATSDQLPDFGEKEEKPAPSFMDYAKDTAKGAIKGALKGIGEFMAGGGESEADIMNVAGTGDRLEGVPTQESIAAAVPRSKTLPGKIAESVMEVGTNPVSYVGPGGFPAKAGAAALSGVGAQLGEEVAGTPGRFIGGTLAPAAVPAARAIAAKTYAAKPVPPARERQVGILREHGIEPPAGDIYGSKKVRAAEEMGELPGGGGSYSREKERVGRETTRAASRFMGADDDQLEPHVFDQVKDDLQMEFELIAARLHAVPDNQFGVDMHTILTDLDHEGLPVEARGRIHKQVDNIIKAMAADPRHQGELSGGTYQSLTRKNAPLDRAMNDADPNISYYANRIRSAMDDMLSRSANRPGTRPGVGQRALDARLREARRKWFSMLVLSKSVDDQGFINFNQLRQNLRNTADNKWAWAAERTNLHQFARAGKAILTPEKSSGTGERIAQWAIPREIAKGVRAAVLPAAGAGAAAGGVVAGLPGAVAGGAGPFVPGLYGRAANSVIGQRYLKGRLPGQQAIPRNLTPEQRAQLIRAPAQGAVDALAPENEDAMQ